MTGMPALQAQVADFVKEHHLSTDVPTRLLDLLSEVGELSKEVLKSNQYGKIDFESTEAWEDELGDVFFTFICLANATDVDMQKCLKTALMKYAGRMKTGGEAGSGS